MLNLLADPSFSYLSLAGLFIYFFISLNNVCLIAVITVLYKKAASFQKDADVVTPEKQGLTSTISGLSEKIDYLYQEAKARHKKAEGGASAAG